jgi:aspartyl-tRNA(Asn)/glutamyl-tRNA(Gln) amidotransferase subunit C
MSEIKIETVKKIAELAKLSLSEDEMSYYAPQLSRILEFIEQMNQAETSHIEPLAHPFEISQRLRPDIITEANLRDKFQIIAPQTEVGLYLVPKVIEEA